MDSFFFFFSTFYDICCLDVCVRGLSVLAALFLNIVIIFCRFFFFFREREREIVSPEGRANFHEGSCMDSLREGLDGTMRILSSAGGCLIAEGRDANGFKLINESYIVYNIYIFYIYNI